MVAGTEDYANMERFLSLLGEDVGPVAITPDTLFDGVKMESTRSTLRRVAIVFAGRIPTEEEYQSIRTGGLTSLRAGIRGLMEGPEFHDFLIRASNDRLFTDRDLEEQIIPRDGLFVDLTNKFYRLIEEAGGDPMNAPEAWEWRGKAQYGAGRAPLELIAHVVENDLPYAQILTGDYIMANPMAAEAYGAPTSYEDPSNPLEFKPSEIVSYYRDDDSKETEIAYDTFTILHVLNPGNLLTFYPHSGILNTTVFLRRYPTTATNRNRARARWTYYHFLGLDIEKSASRTTDPVALADTNNPTMGNTACTVCHSVMDPVAGAFQNYGDEGLYRDQWGGLDSLDGFYKNEFAAARQTIEVNAPRTEPHIISISAQLKAGKERLSLHPRFDPPRAEGSEIWWHMGIDHVVLRDSNGTVVRHMELQELIEEQELCGNPEQSDDHYVPWFCTQNVILDVPADGTYDVEVVLWFDGQHQGVTTQRRFLDISLGGYVEGDAWYRDMRTPGFKGELVSCPINYFKYAVH